MVWIYEISKRSSKMRDRRFVAEHRGGPLKKEQHFQLMIWACDCAENVLYLSEKTTGEQLKKALCTGRRWTEGKAKAGDAMKASVAAHALARELKDPVSVAVARSVGQAVATAHMADHSPGAAWYALKAVKFAGEPVDIERKWQDEQLPEEIKDLVLSARKIKNI
ncbi:MAG: hypothetical protein JXQ82_02170 [Methanomicrobiaceae archaeon]|nr:hypothetical protein [Methanomicrobiaceae archaeon]